MTIRRAATALAVLLLSLSPAASAFKNPIHEDVAEQAARLMPASLRNVLAREIEHLRAGASLPLPVDEASLFLHPDGTGSLDAAVQAQAQRVLDDIAKRAPMSMVARDLGILSHLVALASDPLHVVPPDNRTRDWAASYESFVESRQPRFRVVFTGYGSPALDRDDVRGFVRDCAARTRLTASLLPSLYVLEDGSIARDSSFDDRHPAFGVAALGYSHAISDTARLWLYIWIQANGDSSGLPFPQALPAGQVAAQAP